MSKCFSAKNIISLYSIIGAICLLSFLPGEIKIGELFSLRMYPSAGTVNKKGDNQLNDSQVLLESFLIKNDELKESILFLVEILT